MPDPVPGSGALDFVNEVEQAALTSLNAGPYTRASGFGGIITRERDYPQEDGDIRPYPKSILPAYSVWAEQVSTEVIATNTDEHRIRLNVRSVESATATRDARTKVERMSMEAAKQIGEDIRHNQTSWITSGSSVLTDGDWEFEAPQQHEDNPNMFWKDAAIDVLVYWSSIFAGGL